ncbi:MAG: DinB family protein [Planctomycetota bacterium]
MDHADIQRLLDESQIFLDRSTAALTEADSGFAPTPDTMPAVQILAHIAQAIDWLVDGAFVREDGFCTDFESHMALVRTCTSLDEARERVRAAYDGARATLREQSAERLASPLPEGPIMGGEPRVHVVEAIVDHTAHHRGALGVYARLCGRAPAMPYA